MDYHFIAGKLAFQNKAALDPPQERVKPEDTDHGVHEGTGQVVIAFRVSQFMQHHSVKFSWRQLRR